MKKMIVSLYQSRPMVVLICCSAFSLWWFCPSNQSSDELFYSKEEFAQDMSKIYCDLGLIAEKQFDWGGAINAYSKALQHTPQDEKIRNRIEHCRQCHGHLCKKIPAISRH